MALFLLAAAATPAAAGPHGRSHGHGHVVVRPADAGHGARHRGPRVHRPEGYRVVRPHGRVKPLGWILRGIRRDHPGRLSDVRAVLGPNGEPYYRVKWLTPDGRVLRLSVDARTGQVMDVQGDRNRNRNRGPHEGS
jgi:hypothetical protein